MEDRWIKDHNKGGLVVKAYNFAEDAHRNATRQSGAPYITHPLKVAERLNDWGFDDSTVAAALLHDVVEDTGYKLKDIEDNFGEEVAFLVDRTTKLEDFEYNPSEKKKQAENMRKMVIAISKDLRVVFIKLADRLHNMETLSCLSRQKQKRIASETIDIYASLAYRLGMQKLSGELQDLAFPYLYPRDYKWLRNQVQDRYEERKKYAEKVRPVLKEILEKEGIELVEIDARAKRYFSLYQKLKRNDMQFDRIHDLVALRVMVKNVSDCYRALGVVHSHWPPMLGRIKDYIASPKPNGYRSLHTTVSCIDNKVTEIQIRTKEMHEEAEMGAAAHWAYQQMRNDKNYSKNNAWKPDEDEVKWVQQLRNWESNFKDPEQFLNSLKVDFFQDRIFVATPKHHVIDLPDGATPVDFAYQIHTEVGHQCVGAKVNEKTVSLDYKLHSGDMIEILTQKGKKPSQSWLDFVKTSIARTKIKEAIKSKVNSFKKKHAGIKTVFKIIIKDRSGLLKDVTSVFSRNQISIESSQTHSHDKGKFGTIRITCGEIRESKIEKILVKLKKIKGVLEVSYKSNRK